MSDGYGNLRSVSGPAMWRIGPPLSEIEAQGKELILARKRCEDLEKENQELKDRLAKVEQERDILYRSTEAPVCELKAVTARRGEAKMS